MARKSRSQMEEAQIDMTPMLDVTFIMLIFFITTSSFVKESGVEVLRPQATEAQARPEANVFVGVTVDNQVYVDKRLTEIGAIRQTIEGIKTETPIGAVVIQADKRSKTGTVVQVLDQIKMAGVENVSVAATVD